MVSLDDYLLRTKKLYLAATVFLILSMQTKISERRSLLEDKLCPVYSWIIHLTVFLTRWSNLYRKPVWPMLKGHSLCLVLLKFDLLKFKIVTIKYINNIVYLCILQTFYINHAMHK
jgi:hypothetical protein